MLTTAALGAALATTGPELTSVSALVVERRTGQVLWAKDPERRLFPASTTKILTAMLLAEQTMPDDKITAPLDVKKVTGSSLNLKPGEQVSSRDMVFALMLRSANDACYAVAVHIAGSESAFAELMNRRARELGCTGSQFRNPHGLNDPQHWTTAHDLALIARKALEYPAVAEAARTIKREIGRSLNEKDRVLVNRNKWLKEDPTATGIKTGWTIPAGKCFVGSAERDGTEIVTVLLKGTDWLEDQKRLVAWSFDSFAPGDVVAIGQALGEAPVVDGVRGAVSLVAKEPVRRLVRKGVATPVQSMVWLGSGPLSAPIKSGSPAGHVEIRFWDGMRVKVPVVAGEDIEEAHQWLAAMAGPGGMALGLGLVGAATAMRAKSRRWARRTL
ncbi:MAG: D-alanyl-D-alanine carboxypeptidase [Fimbriimonadaceae bacterium]|nr:D-alanyl-D-alanine carboxypeptidase [Fimbriimonadaceae bacterium]QYK57634.1 MAG: D-alanyl-D-alanine carboxypeptidase [Fimbriimonadaceae bacterium]